MGQPTEVSPADRAATQALARDIVRSVEEDDAMPGLDAIRPMTSDRQEQAVESLVFQLAQELVQTRRELEEALDIAQWLSDNLEHPDSVRNAPNGCAACAYDARIAELRGGKKEGA